MSEYNLAKILPDSTIEYSSANQNLQNVKNIIYEKENPNPFTITFLILIVLLFIYFVYILFIKINISGIWFGNILNLPNPNDILQFYPVEMLLNDINLAIKHNIGIINLCSEPIKVKELLMFCSKSSIINNSLKAPKKRKYNIHNELLYSPDLPFYKQQWNYLLKYVN
jgi:hypothetical protein